MKPDHRYFVYIMSSKSRVIYIGMTNDLVVRVRQHKQKEIAGFSKRYNVDRLVYFEQKKYVLNTIRREKELKAWRRDKKVELIGAVNPRWEDLAADWFDEHGSIQTEVIELFGLLGHAHHSDKTLIGAAKKLRQMGRPVGKADPSLRSG